MTPPIMSWNKLLATSRLGREGESPSRDLRSEFQRDADRIVFSSAFRRLQDKTQVLPLAENDYVRTRLTHSIEVSAVGRSLGTLAGGVVRDFEGREYAPPAEFGNVVAAACLAHDIGNPPFGHPGEDTIRAWFAGPGRDFLTGLSEEEAADFLSFEGNAQGFRILSRLQHPESPGGLQLTHATLGVFTKYPRGAGRAGTRNTDNAPPGKHGFSVSDTEAFRTVAEEVGLLIQSPLAWCRHPLAYLVEAADDICYRVNDLEDACRLGGISFDETEELLAPIATAHGHRPLSTLFGGITDSKSRVELLRARALNELVNAVADAFRRHYGRLMRGEGLGDLVALCRYATDMDRVKAVSVERIYTAPQVVEAQASGAEILWNLLDRFVPLLVNETAPRTPIELRDLAIVAPKVRHDTSRYQRLLSATDFISGMTDTYAVTQFHWS